jgi:hypothetical protein
MKEVVEIELGGRKLRLETGQTGRWQNRPVVR